MQKDSVHNRESESRRSSGQDTALDIAAKLVELMLEKIAEMLVTGETISLILARLSRITSAQG